MLAASTTTSAPAGYVAVIIVAFLAYWIPTFIALIRKSGNVNLGSILVINLFTGWTVIGWLVALVMACRSAPSRPQYVVPPGWVPGPGADQQPPQPPVNPPS